MNDTVDDAYYISESFAYLYNCPAGSPRLPKMLDEIKGVIARRLANGTLPRQSDLEVLRRLASQPYAP